jgi:hypothetical protein
MSHSFPCLRAVVAKIAPSVPPRWRILEPHSGTVRAKCCLSLSATTAAVTFAGSRMKASMSCGWAGNAMAAPSPRLRKQLPHHSLRSRIARHELLQALEDPATRRRVASMDVDSNLHGVYVGRVKIAAFSRTLQ